MPKQFTLSPSDFGFLYKECKTCFYNKYVKKIFRPKQHMPGIFIKIDNLMTQCFDNQPVSLISEDLKDGIVTLGQAKVQSKPIPCKDFDCEIILSGRVDSLIQFDDGTMGILDFKTTEPYQGSAEIYFNQLMSYLVTLEHNDESVNKHYEVTDIGLCYFTPDEFINIDQMKYSLGGNVKWAPLEIDKKKFKNFLKDVAKLLSSDEAPAPGEKCQFCNYKLL